MYTELKIKQEVKELLEKSGWIVTENKNIPDYDNVAIFNFDINWEIYADCILFIKGKAVGIIEIKNSENILNQTLDNCAKAASMYSRTNAPSIQTPLPFLFVSDGHTVLFKDNRYVSQIQKMQSIYTSKQLSNMLNELPYNENLVIEHENLFYSFLKIAASVVFNNKNNSTTYNKYFGANNNESYYKFIQQNDNEKFSLKKIYKFAYFLFYEAFLKTNKLDWFNITEKSDVKDLRVAQYLKGIFTLELSDKLNSFDENIINNNGQIVITYSSANIKINKLPKSNFFENYNKIINNTDIVLIANKESSSFSSEYFNSNDFDTPNIAAQELNKTYIHSDEPVVDDLLDRDIYADGFAKLIMNKDIATPLVSSIFGKWGSGKTSFFRQIRKKVEQIDNDKKYHFIEFNAWKYDDQEQIYAGLMQEIIVQYNNKGKFNFIKYYWKQSKINVFQALFIFLCMVLLTILLMFSDISILDTLHISPVSISLNKILLMAIKPFIIIGLLIYCSKIVFKYSTNFLKDFNNYFKFPDYSEHLGFKKEIEKAINDTLDLWLGKNQKNGKIVLFIDDLDRCSAKKVVQILDCLQIFLNKKGVMVFIAIDNSFVSTLDNQNTDKIQIDNTYFEKIIHIPFLIPEISNNSIYLQSLLNIEENDEHVAINKPYLGKNILSNGTQKIKNNDSEKNKKAIKINNSYQNYNTDVLLTEKDKLAITELSDYLPNNPRLIKRFINIYILSRYFLCNSQACDSYNASLLSTWILLCIKRYDIAEKIKTSIIENTDESKIKEKIKTEKLSINDENLISHFFDLHEKNDVRNCIAITNCFLFNKY